MSVVLACNKGFAAAVYLWWLQDKLPGPVVGLASARDC